MTESADVGGCLKRNGSADGGVRTCIKCGGWARWGECLGGRVLGGGGSGAGLCGKEGVELAGRCLPVAAGCCWLFCERQLRLRVAVDIVTSSSAPINICAHAALHIYSRRSMYRCIGGMLRLRAHQSSLAEVLHAC